MENENQTGQDQPASSKIIQPGQNPEDSQDQSFYREEDNQPPEPEEANSEPAANAQTGEPVSWTGSEYISHQKGIGWYIVLLAAIAVIAGLIYLVTQDLISTIVIIVIGLAFGVFAARKPDTLEYSLNSEGINIDQKTYPYSQFKSFSVHEEGAIVAITLLPLKRFMPTLTVYCPPELEDKILEILVAYLPHEEAEPDRINKMMRRIRF